MESFMRCISRTARCSQLYRSERLEKVGLSGGQYVYISCACRSASRFLYSAAYQVLKASSVVACALSASTSPCRLEICCS